MTQFRFVMQSGPVVGKVYHLDAEEIYIGRESTNTIVINDVQVSRRHAKLEQKGSAYVIQDLGSTNGTFVNGARISGTQALNPGDMVALGEGISLVYESGMDSNATVLSTKSQETVVQHPAHMPAPAPSPEPVYQPAPASAPEPVYQTAPPPLPEPVFKPAPAPVPIPVYSGQVPAGPVPVPAADTPKKKKKFPVWIIIVIILLVIICVCVGFFLVIDQLNLWCRLVPFLVPLLGGTC
jgi:ABC transport system ATP-binding/permease protein